MLYKSDMPTSPNGVRPFHMEIIVEAAAIDANGHVNNVVYVQWMQALAIQHWRAMGGEAINQEHQATWVARSHHIEYLRPAFLDDRIHATTWVHDVGRVRSTRKYAFHRKSDGTLLARGETDWVFIRLADGRPTAIPGLIHGILGTAQE
jgi:acyl-CoA thioester hydrolase